MRAQRGREIGNLAGRFLVAAAVWGDAGTAWAQGQAGAQPPSQGAVAGASAGANAQARSFESLRGEVAPGETLYVLDVSGCEHAGRLTTLSDTSIVLRVDGRPVEFPRETVTRVEKERRAVWEGLALGAGAGAFLGPTIGRESCLNAPIWHCVAKGMMGMGLLGAGIGSLGHVRISLYEASPRGGKAAQRLPEPRRSMMMSVRFDWPR